MCEASDQLRQLIVQIDGLSRPALERAIDQGLMPFLQRMLRDASRYRLCSLYSGLPSTTPAVQGELFYGVRGAVPGFAFLNRIEGTMQHMLDPHAAAVVEDELAQSGGPPLLKDGTSYCNIYVGGARLARFTAAGLSTGSNQRADRRWYHRLRDFLAVFGLIWRAGLMVLGEIWRLLTRRELRLPRGFGSRVRDSFNRIATTIVLRDRARLAALQAIRRGTPVVHLNFLGYDKQAHRFGPDSPAAMRTLGAIDRAIESLVAEWRSSAGAEATVVIYSDHGQESTTPITRRHGQRIEDMVRDIVRELADEPDSPDQASSSAAAGPQNSPQRENASETPMPKRQSLSASLGEQVLGIGSSLDDDRNAPNVITVESGPVAHIYLLFRKDNERRSRISRAIAARVPEIIVLWRSDDTDESDVRAAIGGDVYQNLHELRERQVSNHPFRDALEDDLHRVILHRHAGDIVLFSTGVSRSPITFADEYGSHGGPGPLETHAFAIVPTAFWQSMQSDAQRNWLRPNGLRSMLIRARG